MRGLKSTCIGNNESDLTCVMGIISLTKQYKHGYNICIYVAATQ